MSGMGPGRLTIGLYLHVEGEKGRKFVCSLLRVSWSDGSLFRNGTVVTARIELPACFHALVVSPACGYLVMLAQTDEEHDLSHWGFYLKMRCACLLDR